MTTKTHQDYIAARDAIPDPDNFKHGNRLEVVLTFAQAHIIRQLLSAAIGEEPKCPDCGSEMAMECQGLSVRAGTTGCNSSQPDNVSADMKLPQSEEFKSWTIEYYQSVDGLKRAAIFHDQMDENPVRPTIYGGEGRTDIEAVLNAIAQIPAPTTNGGNDGR